MTELTGHKLASPHLRKSEPEFLASGLANEHYGAAPMLVEPTDEPAKHVASDILVIIDDSRLGRLVKALLEEGRSVWRRHIM